MKLIPRLSVVMALALAPSARAQQPPTASEPPPAPEAAGSPAPEAPPPEAAREPDAPEPTAAEADVATDAELDALRADYEARLAELEGRLDLLEAFAEEDPTPPPAPQPEILTALNPRITVFGNATARLDTMEQLDEEGARIDNRFSLRETEIDFRAAVDPFVDAVLIVALEEEGPGEFHVGVEEGYALIKKLPLPVLASAPWGLGFQVGRFRPALGRLNRIHTHDLPQTTRPLVNQELLGSHGAVGSGVSMGLFLPVDLLDERSTMQLTLQALSGPMGTSDDPTQGLVSLTYSRPLGASHRVEVGGFAHGGADLRDGGEVDRTFAVEALYQWRPPSQGTRRGFVLGGQWMWGERFGIYEPHGHEEEADEHAGHGHEDAALARGFYVFGQVQMSRELFAGVRYDRTERLEEPGRVEAIHPYVSWYPSEFFRLRLGWEHTFYTPTTPDHGTLWFEVNFIFGTHPPEPYWVHR